MKTLIKITLALCLFAGVIHAEENTSSFGADWGVRFSGVAFTDDFDSENVTFGTQVSLEKYLNEFIGVEVYAGARGADWNELDDGRAVDYLGATALARYPIGFIAPFGGIGASTDTIDYRVSLNVKGGVEIRFTKRIGSQVFIAHTTNLDDRSENYAGAGIGLHF